MGTFIVLIAISGDFANMPRLAVWRTSEVAVSTPTKPGIDTALARQQVRHGLKWVPGRTSMAWGEPAARSAHELPAARS